eukprot:1017172-Prymnesium_polylepis.1
MLRGDHVRARDLRSLRFADSAVGAAPSAPTDASHRRRVDPVGAHGASLVAGRRGGSHPATASRRARTAAGNG